jgi:hypothetical protein
MQKHLKLLADLDRVAPVPAALHVAADLARYRATPALASAAI